MASRKHESSLPSSALLQHAAGLGDSRILSVCYGSYGSFIFHSLTSILLLFFTPLFQHEERVVLIFLRLIIILLLLLFLLMFT